jgi:hypothetical protein
MNASEDKTIKLPRGGNITMPNQLTAEKSEVAEKLVQAIGDSRDVLVRATTVFPLTIFPDTVTIDRVKITVTRRDFFSVGEVLSINIEDVLNVTATVGPLFGTVSIGSRFFDQGNKEPYLIKHLWRHDALKIKRIMQGYIAAKQQKVDCQALTTKELAQMLDELGKVASPEKV